MVPAGHPSERGPNYESSSKFRKAGRTLSSSCTAVEDAAAGTGSGAGIASRAERSLIRDALGGDSVDQIGLSG